MGVKRQLKRQGEQISDLLDENGFLPGEPIVNHDGETDEEFGLHGGTIDHTLSDEDLMRARDVLREYLSSGDGAAGDGHDRDTLISATRPTVVGPDGNPISRDGYIEYILDQTNPEGGQNNPNIDQELRELFQIVESGGKDGDGEEVSGRLYKSAQRVVNAYYAIYSVDSLLIHPDRPTGGSVFNAEDIEAAGEETDKEARLAREAAEEAGAAKSGADAVSYILNKEQCVLSHMTRQIIENHFTDELRSQENITMIIDPNVSLIVNFLKGNPKLKDFFNIHNSYLSLMVPKIRLYKQLYKKEGDQIVEIEGDAGQLEFVFDSFTDRTSISQITDSGFGRGRSVGIKSASWSYEGTNPEEVTSFINFDMSIFFQNMQDLLPANFSGEHADTEDLFFDTSNAHLIQLIGAGIGGREEGNNDLDEPRYYTIKAKLGWELDSTITTDLQPGVSIQDIRDIVESTNTFLELSLIEHTINLNEDGTLTLDVKYAAGLDEQLSDRSMNILTIGMENQEDSAIRSILAARDIEPESVGTTSTTTTPEDSNEECGARTNRVRYTDSDGEEHDVDDLSPEEEALLNSVRANVGSPENIFNNYEVFFRRMLQHGKVYEVSIDRKAIYDQISEPLGLNRGPATGDRTGTGDNRNERRANRYELIAERLTIEALENIQIQNIRKIETGEIERFQLLDDSAAEEAQDVANGEEEGETLDLSSTDYQDQLRLELLKELAEEEDKPLYQIKFFRLGDILDAIIEGLKEDPANIFSNDNGKEFNFISGIYTYFDINGIRHGMNFCDILISIKKFREFYTENVVKPLKLIYNLKNFVIDMVTTFSYVNSLRGCQQDTFIRQDSRPVFSVFESDKTNMEVLSRKASEHYNIIYDINAVAPEIADRADASGSPYDDSTFFVIKSDNFAIEGDGNEEDDASRGIYHIKLGADRGVLKKLSFSKDQLEGRREERITRAGGMNLSALREKYNAEVTLFGCPFLFPGMYVYIDPSMIGMGFSDQASSASRILGVGGYYFINKASNNITSDGFYETVIETIWNTFGEQPCSPVMIDSNQDAGDLIVPEPPVTLVRPIETSIRDALIEMNDHFDQTPAGEAGGRLIVPPTGAPIFIPGGGRQF